MNPTAARIAARARRLLPRRGRAEATPAPTYELDPAVCRALAQAIVFERPGADERHPRVVVSIPGKAPFLDGEAPTADQLRARFPTELKTPGQAEVAERFLKQVLRQRRRANKGGSWATNW